MSARGWLIAGAASLHARGVCRVPHAVCSEVMSARGWLIAGAASLHARGVCRVPHAVCSEVMSARGWLSAGAALLHARGVCRVPHAVCSEVMTARGWLSAGASSLHARGVCCEGGRQEQTRPVARGAGGGMSQEEEVRAVVAEGKPLTAAQWQAFIDRLLACGGFLSKVNVDGVVMKTCVSLRQLEVGSSFLDYLLASERRANVAALSLYLRLCHACSPGAASRPLQDRIVAVSDSLQRSCRVLDATTAENILCGLALTSRWREGLRLLAVVKATGNPASYAYNAVARAALDAGDWHVGAGLLEEMVSRGKRPLPDTYRAWLRLCSRLDRGEPRGDRGLALEVLRHFRASGTRPTRETAQDLRRWFKSRDPNWSGRVTTVNPRGVCQSCKKTLHAVALTPQEFDDLRAALMDRLLVGGDVFRRTTPDELEAFERFVGRTAPYDVVIDGLNVAYSTNTSRPSLALQKVVRHFVVRGQRVCVLGRHHMLGWPKTHMDYVHRNAKVFLAENISQDDPFLLYATMFSGAETCFVSRDLMRGHVFRLQEPALRAAFRRWQQQHQYQVVHISEDNHGHVQLKVGQPPPAACPHTPTPYMAALPSSRPWPSTPRCSTRPPTPGTCRSTTPTTPSRRTHWTLPHTGCACRAEDR